MIKIEGQPSLFLLDLKGKEYPAIAEVNRKKRVNGQREITLSFYYDEINELFIHDVEFGWKLLFRGEWYTITAPTYALDGNKFSVGVDAVLSFFVDMNGHYLQDEVEDKSMTPANYFRDLFKDTDYSYVLVDNLSSNTLNYQPNQSKTERFLYGVDRFKGEYKVQGKQAYIHSLIGSDKDVILHEDLNIKDVSIEVNASGFHTWAKGFGDKDESKENAEYELEVEYISPLVEKYGYIEGPAIRDGKYKKKKELENAVKKQVENSYKISSAIDAVDLTNNGYPEMQFEEGDRIWLYVTDLKQNQQVRVMEIEETFDWEGNIIDAKYTLGDEGIATRYKTQQYDTIKDFNDIQNGRKKIEKSWLDDAVQRASDIINGNLTSYFEYGVGEIIGINKDDPNGYMRFNTDGIGFSRDGGKTYRTAITYEGIVADAITAGTLRGIVTEGVEIYGGALYSLNNDNTYWDLESGKLKMQNANFELGGSARIKFTNQRNKIQYTKDDNTAGMGVSDSLNENYPFVYIGVTQGEYLGAFEENNFSGFIANAHERYIDDDWQNSVVGRRFSIRSKSKNTDPNYVERGFTFNLWGSGEKAFYPINTGTHKYKLGRSNNRWDEVHAKTYHGSLANTSTHNAKINIEDIDGEQAFDYFDMMKVKSYYYKDDDYTNPYNKKVSPVIEQLDPTLEKLYKSNNDALDISSNLFLLAQAFKYFAKITNDRFEVLENE